VVHKVSGREMPMILNDLHWYDCETVFEAVRLITGIYQAVNRHLKRGFGDAKQEIVENQGTFNVYMDLLTGQWRGCQY
jgi:hypothetical protein